MGPAVSSNYILLHMNKLLVGCGSLCGKKQWMKHVSSLNHTGVKMKRFPCQLEYTVPQIKCLLCCFVTLLTLILWTDFPSSRSWLHTVIPNLLYLKLQPSSHRHSALKLANARSSGMVTVCPDMARYRGGEREREKKGRVKGGSEGVF